MGKSGECTGNEVLVAEKSKSRPVSKVIATCYFAMGISLVVGYYVPPFYSNILMHVSAFIGIIGALLFMIRFFGEGAEGDMAKEHANRKSFWFRVIANKKYSDFAAIFYWCTTIVIAISNFSYIHPPHSTVLLFVSLFLLLGGFLFVLYVLIIRCENAMKL